jgi:hypothetical protein
MLVTLALPGAEFTEPVEASTQRVIPGGRPRRIAYRETVLFEWPAARP